MDSKLASLGVKTAIDLALILPKSFEDLSISSEPKEGENVSEVEIKFAQNRGYIYLITAYSLSWEIEIKIAIFNAKGWHYSAFKAGKRLFLHGKLSFYNNQWQFTNPKIITAPGGITPKYKLSLRDKTIQNLIEKNLKFEELINEGLNEKEANLLLKIHENSKESVKILRNLDKNPEILDTLKFIEIYNYIKKLSKKKYIFRAKEFEIFDIKNWLKTLPFTPTNDQISALNDIKNDFKSGVAVRRVVMGDVGSGKTLVILGAALLAYPNTAILMVPTTILAEQIYLEAKRLLPEFMSVVLIKSGEKDDDIKEKFSGANFIIGTHTLLFKNLPKAVLVMVDEQHRFGSNQRSKIAKLTKDGEFSSHFIQFSATPIPRTMTLIQSNLAKFSFLKQMPFPKNIKTLIIKSSGFRGLLGHLRDEISKNNQAIIVYPLVKENETSNYQSLEEGVSFWQKNFENVFVTHGKDSKKDEILASFRDTGDILVTTTVVEVGISLPRLSIIVIVAPERMGLATLHQLRGRVGRLGGEAWCYLFTKLSEIPPRLKEFAQTMDGFKVAEIDLKNRLGGDLLDGSIQHGAMFLFYAYEEDITQKANERLESFTKNG